MKSTVACVTLGARVKVMDTGIMTRVTDLHAGWTVKGLLGWSLVLLQQETRYTTQAMYVHVYIDL